MKNFKPQVNPEHYKKNYDTISRFISYFIQIKSIIELKPKNILEIGIGNDVVSNYLKKQKIKVTTCDIDKKLKPDYIGDIRELPFKNNQFDCTLACEVLEHIPYSDFQKALLEINRISKRYAIISIPYSTFNIYGFIKLIPGTKPKIYSIKILEKFLQEHKFNGEHYWEMGKKNYPKKRIKKDIENTKWLIKKEFFQPLDPYHYFFILEKRLSFK